MLRTLSLILAGGILLAGCRASDSPTRQGGAEHIIPGKVIGPYSPAVRAGGFLFVSGQIALDPVTGTMKNGSIEEETAQVLDNLEAVLKASGSSAAELVSATVYLTDMNNYTVVNGIYGKRFPEGKYPARVAVQVAALPRGARIEISAIAWRN
jgi:2-iminobutanoate/2-iminopropanoate deaminase